MLTSHWNRSNGTAIADFNGPPIFTARYGADPDDFSFKESSSRLAATMMAPQNPMERLSIQVNQRGGIMKGIQLNQMSSGRFTPTEVLSSGKISRKEVKRMIVCSKRLATSTENALSSELVDQFDTEKAIDTLDNSDEVTSDTSPQH